MSQKVKMYPEVVAEVAALDTHQDCVLAEFSNCAIPNCWFKRIRHDQKLILLRATAASTAFKDKAALTYQASYWCSDYELFVESNDGGSWAPGEKPKIKLRVTIEDDNKKPFTTVIDDTVGPLELDPRHLATSFAEHIRHNEASKFKQLRELVDRWNEPKPEFKVGDIVKIKKNMFNNGIDRDSYYVIHSLGETDALMKKMLYWGKKQGVIEPFDCVLGVIDSTGDFVFVPGTTNRLELAKEPSEVATSGTDEISIK